MEKPTERQESELETALRRTSYDSGFERCARTPQNLISYFDSKRLNPDFRTSAFIRGVEDAVSMGESSIADTLDFDSALLEYCALPGPSGNVYAKSGDTFTRKGSDYQIVKCVKAEKENPGAVYVMAIEIDSCGSTQIEFTGKEAAELLLKSNSR
jgi:hypothetical protein